MSNLIGQTIGNYRIAEMVGRGGMGSVYRAQHLTLEREVAVKFLAQNLSGDDEFIKRFLREARLVAKLDHPNIVRVFDGGEYEGTPYLVMELLEGETLRQKIKRGALSEAETLSIGAAVLAGLGKAHALKVVHRDIKPANIFLCQDGAVKVMDFGIAKAATEARLTGTGMQMGTPEYMSPEQADGAAVDGRSDLYSVGIMLYEMLTGQVPFTADTPLSVLHMQVSKPVPALPSSISEWLRRLVECALEKSPSARFATAEQMREALLSKKMPAKQAVSDLDLDFSAGVQRSTREQRREASRVESGFSGAQSGPGGVVEGSRQAPVQSVASMAAVSSSDAKSVVQTSLAQSSGAQAGVSASSGAGVMQKQRPEAGVDRGRTNMMVFVGGGFCALVVLIVLIIVAAIHFAPNDDNSTHNGSSDQGNTSNQNTSGTQNGNASGGNQTGGTGGTQTGSNAGPTAEQMAEDAFHMVTRDRLTDAQSKAREAITQDSKNANAHAALGVALAESYAVSKVIDDAKTSLTELETALNLDKNNARALAGFGSLAYALSGQAKTQSDRDKDLSNARTDLEKAISLDSNLAYAYNQLGIVDEDQQRIADAETHLKRAIELDPGIAWTHTNLAYLYIAQKKYADAETAAQTDVQNGMATDGTYYELGLADYEQSKAKEAEDAFRQAIRMNPKNGNYHAMLAAALHYEKNDVEAKQEATQARQLGVTDHWIYKELGM